jgi:hypothetical protein
MEGLFLGWHGISGENEAFILGFYRKFFAWLL